MEQNKNVRVEKQNNVVWISDRVWCSTPSEYTHSSRSDKGGKYVPIEVKDGKLSQMEIIHRIIPP